MERRELKKQLSEILIRLKTVEDSNFSLSIDIDALKDYNYNNLGKCPVEQKEKKKQFNKCYGRQIIEYLPIAGCRDKHKPVLYCPCYTCKYKYIIQKKGFCIEERICEKTRCCSFDICNLRNN